MRLVAFAMAPLLLGCSADGPALAKDNRAGEWKPGSYLGLNLGTSKKADLQRLLGRPIHEQPFFTEGEPVTHDEILSYKNVGDVPGVTNIVIDQRTWIVTEVHVHPEDLSVEEAIKILGPGYILHGSPDGPCAFSDRIPPEPDSIAFYSYPELGAFITARDGEVQEIGYLAHCETAPTDESP